MGMDYVNYMLANKVVKLGHFLFMNLTTPDIIFHDDYLSIQVNTVYDFLRSDFEPSNNNNEWEYWESSSTFMDEFPVRQAVTL